MTLRLGMLTPSSNTVLEPVTAAMLAGMPDVTAHFSRFRVTEIALGRAALGQFDDEPMLAAADLLGHAKVDVVTWNGTSASWLGLDRDRALATRISDRTGARTTTCVLSLFDLFARHGIGSIGLVTPYTGDVQARVAEVYGREGVRVAAESHLGIADNFSFGTVDAATLDRQVAAAVAGRPDAVVILCTNVAGGPHVARWEAEHGVPVLDSVAVALHGALAAAGRGGLGDARWGRLLA
ncbi:maleate cis-trans isomerase family protein [Prosthecomicrobium sp. N25]|uniref:maleate cis-trans isomerase family protein n=1 Tax=Prosthecomicrobium sp. N25 TaxID=3129254 RepID=UPI0030781C53